MFTLQNSKHCEIPSANCVKDGDNQIITFTPLLYPSINDVGQIDPIHTGRVLTANCLATLSPWEGIKQDILAKAEAYPLAEIALSDAQAAKDTAYVTLGIEALENAVEVKKQAVAVVEATKSAITEATAAKYIEDLQTANNSLLVATVNLENKQEEIKTLEDDLKEAHQAFVELEEYEMFIDCEVI